MWSSFRQAHSTKKKWELMRWGQTMLDWEATSLALFGVSCTSLKSQMPEWSRELKAHRNNMFSVEFILSYERRSNNSVDCYASLCKWGVNPVPIIFQQYVFCRMGSWVGYGWPLFAGDRCQCANGELLKGKLDYKLVLRPQMADRVTSQFTCLKVAALRQWCLSRK
jgi:hypothetical protein